MLANLCSMLSMLRQASASTRRRNAPRSFGACGPTSLGVPWAFGASAKRSGKPCPWTLTSAAGSNSAVVLTPSEAVCCNPAVGPILPARLILTLASLLCETFGLITCRRQTFDGTATVPLPLLVSSFGGGGKPGVGDRDLRGPRSPNRLHWSPVQPGPHTPEGSRGQRHGLAEDTRATSGAGAVCHASTTLLSVYSDIATYHAKLTDCMPLKAATVANMTVQFAHMHHTRSCNHLHPVPVPFVLYSLHKHLPHSRCA